MRTERIFKEQLFSRVEELYSENSLDTSIVEFDSVSELYDCASKKLTAALGVKEEREWSAYGCGFASFFESWFYYEKPEFEFQYEGMYGKGYNGVCIVYSLLEPMFAAGEAEKTLGEYGGSGIMPSLRMIDEYKSTAVKALSTQICSQLRASGIPQVSKRTLSEPIAPGIAIESNLKEGKLKLFDAFYHWMD